jgi:hypothetical protein
MGRMEVGSSSRLDIQNKTNNRAFQSAFNGHHRILSAFFGLVQSHLSNSKDTKNQELANIMNKAKFEVRLSKLQGSRGNNNHKI